VSTRRRLRVLLHAPHLSGVGHHVRLREVGRALALRHHRVGYFCGGRPVPGAWPQAVQSLPLPGLARGPDGLGSLATGPDLAATLGARQAAIRTAVASWRPDVVVIEHYPFSKWELAAEFDALIDAARMANRAARVVCSVRDIPRQTRHEACSADEWAGRVASALNDRFDALLIHGEPALTPLAESFPGVSALRQPPLYTGIVAEPLPRRRPDSGATFEALTGGAAFVLVSIGGGNDDAALLVLARNAWLELAARGGTGGRRLVLVHGLAGAAAALSATDTGITSLPFSPDFLAWLAVADLSISHAGYNTCANLLATRTRAILVPNPRMSDQGTRAERMQSLGAARSLSVAGLAPAALAEAISVVLQGPRPTHGLRLDGATRTAQLLEQLAG
jgi:predicted glycosyltransferase